MALQLNNLKKSVDSLDRALKVADNSDSFSDDLRETVRAGVVQNFEVAYEQCWKYIQRWIKDKGMFVETENLLSKKDLFRSAARYGLIDDPVPWFEYGDARNLSAHTYDEKRVKVIYETAKKFINDAKILVENLERNND